MATKQKPPKASASKAWTPPTTGQGRRFNACHPDWFRKCLDDYQAGNRWEPDQEVNDPNTYKWEDVHALFQSGGNPNTLGKMLRRRPTLLWHPVVGDLIRNIKREWQRERQVNCSNPGDLEVYNEHIKEPLKELVEAWVHGMLEGDYTIKPPKKKRGPRPSEEKMELRWYLYSEYRATLDELKDFPVAPQKAEGESDNSTKEKEYEKWKRRLVEDVLPTVWEKSGRSMLFEFGPADKGKPFLERRVPGGTIPFPTEQARSWVEKAIKRRANNVIRDLLAYELVGFWNGRTASQVRHAVEQAQRLVYPTPRPQRKAKPSTPRSR